MSSDATETPPPSLIGGKYELRELIGRGGMGSVYEGRHVSLGTPVAIKFIDAEYANSGDAKSRFDTEARAAATIQSKHAIQIFDHGVSADGRPYIVMELLVGEPLDKRIARAGSLPLSDTARMIRQVARALSRAHERGIVHRDLKPENIFLVRGPDDDEDVAKVLDFGIAKIKAAPGAIGVSSSTKTGTLLGTPFFMSPEQARGLRSVDHRSDLWSLGVIVFKCVTGVLPFDGESLGDLLVKICTAPIPLPSHVVPSLPAPLDAWMSRALDREPDARFQSASELADSLGALAGLSFPRPPSSRSTPDPSGPIPSSPYSPRTSSSPSSRGSTQVDPFSGPQYSEPIPAATSAPLTAPAPQSLRRSSKLGYVGGAAFGLAAGFALVFYFLAGSKPHATQGFAIGTQPPAVSIPAAPLPPASTLVPATAPTPQPIETAAAVPPLDPPPPAARGAKPAAPKPRPKAPAANAPTAINGTPLPPAGPAVAPPPAPPAPAPKPNPNVGEPGY